MTLRGASTLEGLNITVFCKYPVLKATNREANRLFVVVYVSFLVVAVYVQFPCVCIIFCWFLRTMESKHGIYATRALLD